MSGCKCCLNCEKHLINKIKQEIASKLPTQSKEYAIIMQTIDEVREREQK